jgi:hypothetical protein
MQRTSFKGRHEIVSQHRRVAPRNEGSNLLFIPKWLNMTFNFVSREKCLKGAWKALAVYMVISLEGCKNIKSSLAFFDKAKGSKKKTRTRIFCLP